MSPRLGGARHAGSQRTNSIDEPDSQRRAHSVSLDPPRRWGSVACMSQLQAKHAAHGVHEVRASQIGTARAVRTNAASVVPGHGEAYHVQHVTEL